MQRSCVITGKMSLRYLEIEFFRLKMDFIKKKSQMWVEVDQKFFDQIKNKVLQAKKNNLQARPTGCGKTYFF